MRFPVQVCGACGGKGHSAKICSTNVVIVFACEAEARDSDGDKILGGEAKYAFVCDASGMFFDESVRGIAACLLGTWEISR